MSFNWNLEISTKNFTIQIDTQAKYGYFEHEKLGDGCAGGLWFDGSDTTNLRLMDYDGVYELPREVLNKLVNERYIHPDDQELF